MLVHLWGCMPYILTGIRAASWEDAQNRLGALQDVLIKYVGLYLPQGMKRLREGEVNDEGECRKRQKNGEGKDTAIFMERNTSCM